MENLSVYPAAALFNGRENYFNSCLAERLEEKGYETNLPQRDGFEFGIVGEELSKFIGKDKIEEAVQNIIYFLDMGYLIPKSDVVLANLDEPLDDGVIVEISYAKIFGKLVIGFRTDVRSPYGSGDNKFGGMHFFPAYQCNKLIKREMFARSFEEREKEMDGLVEEIDKTIKESDIEVGKVETFGNPKLDSVIEGAKILFEGVEEIHSKEGVKEISRRYLENEEKLKELLN